MERYGMWWWDPKAYFSISNIDFTKEEAEHILPQILSKKKNRESSLILVSLPDDTTFYVYVWDGQTAELPGDGKRTVRVNTKEDIPVHYKSLLIKG